MHPQIYRRRAVTCLDALRQLFYCQHVKESFSNVKVQSTRINIDCVSLEFLGTEKLEEKKLYVLLTIGPSIERSWEMWRMQLKGGGQRQDCSA